MDRLVTVFGGSGFVGRVVVRALARRGWRVRVVLRKPHLGYKLRPLGDVGQIEFARGDVRDADSVVRALTGAEAAVNLVGVLYQRGTQTFQRLHADAAEGVAAAARAAGASRFVQMSALGADARSASLYARSKAEGEARVQAIYPDAVILRPSIVFGPEDDFFNRFAAMAGVAPALPLVGGGATRFQPVYVGDVAQALAEALDSGRGVYELAGPQTYTFKDLLELVLRETGRSRLLAPLPWPIASVIGRVAETLPLPPVLTADQVTLLRSDNVASGQAPGLEALGVSPTPVEAVVPSYLWRYRKGGQFANITPAEFLTHRSHGA